jgi:hypothetical protein
MKARMAEWGLKKSAKASDRKLILPNLQPPAILRKDTTLPVERRTVKQAKIKRWQERTGILPFGTELDPHIDLCKSYTRFSKAV